MNCKYCNSTNLIERQVDNVHKIGVWCKDCERHAKWGKLLKEETKMFEINHEESYAGSKLMPVGDYEVVIKSAYEDATKNGAMYISIPLIIRNDVEQSYKNKYIFHAIWKNKESGQYNLKAINTIAKVIQIPNGTKFESLEQLLDAFKGKVAKVTIKHEEYNGNTNEKVSFWNVSGFPECKHVFKATTTTQEATQEGVDDLPF